MMSEALQALGALKILSERIHESEVRAKERLKSQHGRFNIFTTLLKATDEVRLHTRFIHELLNPDGTHDCGDLFLKLFFEILKEHPPLNHDDSTTSEIWDDYTKQSFELGKEIRTDQGQLDLLLNSDTHLLVIENKIWASEEQNQIARYIEYLEQQPKNGKVIYLTLDGKRAETHNGKSYLRISYREHIIAWLNRCLQATDHIVPINQVIIQYKKVVEKISVPSVQNDTMNTIKEYIRKNPAIIRYNNAIQSALSTLHIKILDKFADQVIEKLSDDFEVTFRPGMTDSRFGKDKHPGHVVTPPENFQIKGHFFEIWIEKNPWKGWAIGIETAYGKKHPVTKEELKLLEEQIYPRLSKEYQDKDEHYSKATQTWKGTHWPCSWHNIIEGFMCDDEFIAQMFEPSYFTSQVKTTADEVRTFVNRFKKIYLDEVKHPRN